MRWEVDPRHTELLANHPGLKDCRYTCTPGNKINELEPAPLPEPGSVEEQLMQQEITKIVRSE